MGRRASYAPGTFSWVELATTDASAAKTFYSGLFGWELEDRNGGATTYTLCRTDGDVVCGLYELPELRRTPDVPPNWMSYVTVDDAAAAAAHAGDLGGEVLDDAFDVQDAGRMAVLRDPQGAVFAVWQPGSRIGAERVNDVGCLCMNELVTTDMPAASAFYGALFGWTTDLAGAASGGPSMVVNGGNINAAVFTAPDSVPPHWRPCFTVDSTAAAMERVRALGGQQLLEPLEIGHGSIAMALDPQGALFTVFAGETHP